MTYSGGQPLLYPVGFINFFMIYWVFKILLTKYYKKTTAFNHELPIKSISYFRISLAFHFIISLVSFTNSNILSTGNIDFIKDVSSEFTMYTQMTDGNKLHKRFLTGIGLGYIAIIIALYLIRFFFKVLKKFLSGLCGFLCCCCKEK